MTKEELKFELDKLQLMELTEKRIIEIIRDISSYYPKRNVPK